MDRSAGAPDRSTRSLPDGFGTSVLVAAVMGAQAGLGLLLPDAYRDVGYVRETWFGNDLVTFAVALPLLVAALARERAAGRGGRHETRARILWIGALGYGAYNYAFYLFGAALNAFFPLYVAGVVASAAALIRVLAATDPKWVASSFHPRTPVRAVGGYLVLVAGALSTVWLLMWARHVFAGAPTPVPPEAFRLVAALDLTVMVPALAAGGVLLWRRRPWGFALASLAAIQGALYLLVLAVNATIFLARGSVEPPGELPLWGTLVVATGAAAAVLLGAAGRRAPGLP